ncbi:FAD-binding oxidoreductase [Acinetobacter qingfengensis]|uniref:Uncharacterized protein n=1 Tax=Acinetobacter qingfengensis TaxID=1262585 RepID=A0A1E7RBT2_9GAMM|nr:hypothetical protein [Acinetobacter qingfengensis]KAA8734855.1 FAD-binding oxidoreductase [Acinetobacter qingfengensis]OEY96899.1 hypothetical protein BJI46_11970 [Acinetobacter qingfengensis]
MKNKPWIDGDPLRDYYGLLTKYDLDWFLNFFNQWNTNNTLSDLNILEIKDGIKLLDFSENYNDFCQFTLYEKLCYFMGNNEQYIYWIPISNNEDRVFEDYEPLMIAKIPFRVEDMNSVRRSFMQMQNGGYMMLDSKSRFVSIIVDGYYMLVFLSKKYMNEDLLPYIENWKLVDDNLDDILKEDLFKRL